VRVTVGWDILEVVVVTEGHFVVAVAEAECAAAEEEEVEEEETVDVLSTRRTGVTSVDARDIMQGTATPIEDATAGRIAGRVPVIVGAGPVPGTPVAVPATGSAGLNAAGPTIVVVAGLRTIVRIVRLPVTSPGIVAAAARNVVRLPGPRAVRVIDLKRVPHRPVDPGLVPKSRKMVLTVGRKKSDEWGVKITFDSRAAP